MKFHKKNWKLYKLTNKSSNKNEQFMVEWSVSITVSFWMALTQGWLWSNTFNRLHISDTQCYVGVTIWYARPSCWCHPNIILHTNVGDSNPCTLCTEPLAVPGCMYGCMGATTADQSLSIHSKLMQYWLALVNTMNVSAFQSQLYIKTGPFELQMGPLFCEKLTQITSCVTGCTMSSFRKWNHSISLT